MPAKMLLMTICTLIPLLVVGCSDASLPKVVPVKGTVSYNGKPLDHGEIVFEPEKPAPGFPFRPTSSPIGKDGGYVMSSFARGDGVVPGEYRVRVICLKGGQTFETPEAKWVWLIPKKYADSETSGLTLSVSPDEKEGLVRDFDLVD